MIGSAIVAGLLLGVPLTEQDQSTSSSTTTSVGGTSVVIPTNTDNPYKTTNVEGIPVTINSSSTPVAGGTYKTNNATLGDGSKTTIYAGSATSSSGPSDQGQTSASVGVAIPWGEPPKKSNSTGSSKVSNR